MKEIGTLSLVNHTFHSKVLTLRCLLTNGLRLSSCLLYIRGVVYETRSALDSSVSPPSISSDDVQLPPPDTAALLSQPDSTQPDPVPTSTSSLGGPAAAGGGGACHTTTTASGGQPKWFKLGKK